MPSSPSEIAKLAARNVVPLTATYLPDSAALIIQAAIDEATAPLQASHAALAEALGSHCDLVLDDGTLCFCNRDEHANFCVDSRAALAAARKLMEADDAE